MIVSVVIIALFGVYNVGGLAEVWNRAVDGDRIFPPEYVKMISNQNKYFFKSQFWFEIDFFSKNIFYFLNFIVLHLIWLHERHFGIQ